jgi:FtsH-binding integral membrane protein
MSEKRDLENGTTTTETRTLYPMMLENPQLRWSFIRKVYSIITFQLLLTIVVASVVVFVPPIAHFFVSSTQGLILYIVLIFVPFIYVSCSLYMMIDDYYNTN